MSNEKPLKLDMSFTQALQMIAKGGKPSEAKTKSATKPKPKKKTTVKKKPS
jgi:hypothetical protein